MRAAVLEAAGQPLVVVDDVDVEAPGVGEVEVAVAHCGICHSDLSLIDGHMPPSTPLVLGHEAAGVVTAVGPGVTRLQEGDHVVLTPCPPCGNCYFCVRGEWSICLNSRSLMTSAHPDGGTRLSRGGEVVYRGLGVAAFAETVITEATGAVKIPDDVPLEVACVLGCAVQTGVGAVLNTAKVREGDSMLVMGLGGVGLSVVQGGRLASASTVIVSDPVAERRELALRLGATHALDPATDDVMSACLDLTEHGVDFAFDAVGSNALIETGINATRVGGTTVLVGVAPLTEALSYPSATIFAAMAKNILGCLLGSANSLHEIPRLIDLWRAGRLDLEPLITGHRPLADINLALDDLRASVGVRTVIDL
jgi:Zn-dependent alcohol dehydrogenase